MSYRLIIGKRNINTIINQIKTKIPASETHIDLSSEYEIDGNDAVCINIISADNLVTVFKAFDENITSLDMRLHDLCRFSPDDLIKIVKAFPQKLVALDWQGNGLGKFSTADLIRIIKALPENLSFLGLRGNELYKLSVDDCSSVVQALSGDLQSCDLSGNLYGYSADDIVTILKALPKDLASLEPGWSDLNKFTLVELVKIIGALPENLKTLKLPFNKLIQFSHENLCMVMHALGKNLHCLDVSMNDLDKMPAEDLSLVMRNVPITVTSVFIKPNKAFDPLVFVIENEINRLMNTHSSRDILLVGWGFIEASDVKIKALNELKDIIGKRTGISLIDLQDELVLWHEAHKDNIRIQRNKIHSFFVPTHKAVTQTIVEELLVKCGITLDAKSQVSELA